MNIRASVFVFAATTLVVTVAGGLAACSSDDSTGGPSAGLDGGDSPDASRDMNLGDAGESPEDAGADAAQAFNSCTDAQLAAATLATNGSDVSFFTAGVDGGANVYTNNCVRIPRGKDVGWYGDFTTHPLANNGEPGTPIPNVATGNDTGRITFPTAGKFSFHCASHPSTMFGTVLVEP